MPERLSEIHQRRLVSQATLPVPSQIEKEEVRKTIIEARLGILQNAVRSVPGPKPTINLLRFIHAGMTNFCMASDLEYDRSAERVFEMLDYIKPELLAWSSQVDDTGGMIDDDQMFAILQRKPGIQFESDRFSKLRRFLGVVDGIPSGIRNDRSPAESEEYIIQAAHEIDAIKESQERTRRLGKNYPILSYGQIDHILSVYWRAQDAVEAAQVLRIGPQQFTRYMKSVRVATEASTLEKAFLTAIDNGTVIVPEKTDKTPTLHLTNLRFAVVDDLRCTGANINELANRYKLSEHQAHKIIQEAAYLVGLKGHEDYSFALFRWIITNNLAPTEAKRSFVTDPSAEPKQKPLAEFQLTTDPIELLVDINPQFISIAREVAKDPQLDFNQLGGSIGYKQRQIIHAFVQLRKRLEVETNEAVILMLWKTGIIQISQDQKDGQPLPAVKAADQRLQRTLEFFLNTGAPNKQIAAEFGITVGVAESYMQQILKAWNVNNRRTLFVEAIRRGNVVLSGEPYV